MAQDLIQRIIFRTDDSELDTSEKKLTNIEDSLKSINDPKAFDQIEKEFKELNHVIDTSSLSFSEMGKAIEQYQTIALKAGTESPVGQEAIQRAGELKDRMDEVTTSVDMLSKKGVALQGALELGTTVTAGYGAFIGITQLAGAESEKFEKALTKLMAVQTTLSSLEQIRLALQKESIIVTKAQIIWTKSVTAVERMLIKARWGQNAATIATTASTKALASALVATGIGAIVVVLGTLVSKLMEASDETDKMAQEQEKLAEATKKANIELEKQSKTISVNMAEFEVNLKKQIIAAKAAGATDEELAKIRQENQKDRLQILLDDYNNAFDLYAKFAKAGREQAAKEAKQVADNLWKQYQTLQLEILDQEAEISRARIWANNEVEETDKENNKNQNDRTEETGRLRTSWLITEFKLLMKIEEEKKKLQQEEFERIAKLNQARIALEEETRSQRRETNRQQQENAKKELLIQQELNHKKLQMASDAFGALGELVQAFSMMDEENARKQFKIAKAFNIAQATIQTAQAITGALTAGGNPAKLATGQQIVEAAIVGAMGAAQIIKIASTQFQPTGGTSGSGSDFTGGAVANLLQNVQGSSGIQNQGNETTDIDELLNGSNGSGITPVLVVDSFTKVAEKQKKIESLGSI